LLLILNEFYFLGFILIILILRIYKFANYNNIKKFNFLIKCVIFGLIIEILILYLHFIFGSFINSSMEIKFLFCHNQFIFSFFIIYLKIFICFIVICIFISFLDYFKFENYINYDLPLLILLSLEGMFLMLIAMIF
jgi:hypothetical protein